MVGKRWPKIQNNDMQMLMLCRRQSAPAVVSCSGLLSGATQILISHLGQRTVSILSVESLLMEQCRLSFSGML